MCRIHATAARSLCGYGDGAGGDGDAIVVSVDAAAVLAGDGDVQLAAVDGQGAVKDHNGGPAYQLDDVQNREQQRALGAEAHFGGIHGAFAYLAADEARQIQHDAADDMAQENGQQTLPKAQGGKVGAGEDLRDGDRRAEPDEAVFKYGGTFFFHVLRLL